MKISLVSIMVEDQEKALSFYTNILGFVKKTDIPMGEFRWITVVSPENENGTELALEPNVFEAAKTFQKSIFDQGMPYTAFEIGNIAEEFFRLKELGVKFTMEPTKMDGGPTLAIFNDTCGNLIQIYQP